MARIQSFPQLLSHFQGRGGPEALTQGPEMMKVVGHRQMDAFRRASGFRSDYIGDWSHTRGQLMMRYQPVQQSAWKRRF